MTLDEITIACWFFGPHRGSGLPSYKVAEENRRLALQRIGPITVTPEELVLAIEADGITYHNSERLITKLLLRAEQAAVRKTLGLPEVLA